MVEAIERTTSRHGLEHHGLRREHVFPGTELWFQLGIVDGSVPIHGASLSNGVKGTVP